MTAAEPAKILKLVKVLDRMLRRPQLRAICEQLVGEAIFEGVGMLEEAVLRQLNLRKTLARHPTDSGAKALRNLW
jgi:hypothetical protein